MLFNVWGIIWPNNKKVIRGTLAGTPPADAPALSRQAFLASRMNFFLSVPLLFYMAASSHFSRHGDLREVGSDSAIWGLRRCGFELFIAARAAFSCPSLMPLSGEGTL